MARTLAPQAGVLSPRGKVLERGMPRFFRRLSEGVFDVEDLRFRAGELADFIAAAAIHYNFDARRVIAAGFSNGANIAGSLLLLRPEALGAAVLFRAMVPLVPAELPHSRRDAGAHLERTARPAGLDRRNGAAGGALDAGGRRRDPPMAARRPRAHAARRSRSETVARYAGGRGAQFVVFLAAPAAPGHGAARCADSHTRSRPPARGTARPPAAPSSRPAARTSAPGSRGCPRIGTTGPSGARNGRSASGCVFRMMRTAAQTITNASSVPMLTSSARIRSGRNAAMIDTADAGEDRRLPRRAESRVHGAEEPGRQQPVARHREKDPRLAQHHHEQHRRDARDRANRDQELRPRQSHLPERIRYRRVDVDLVVAEPSRSGPPRPRCTASCTAPARR